MKKRLMILTMICVFLIPCVAFADWVVDISSINKKGSTSYFSATFTSDGTDPDAIDVLSKMGFSKAVKGKQIRFMYVSPGTSTVAPDTTIDIVITNQGSREIWSKTGISYTAGIWHKMWEDLGDYPTILEELNIDFNYIGPDGDQVTLHFECFEN